LSCGHLGSDGWCHVVGGVEEAAPVETAQSQGVGQPGARVAKAAAGWFGGVGGSGGQDGGSCGGEAGQGGQLVEQASGFAGGDALGVEVVEDAAGLFDR